MPKDQNLSPCAALTKISRKRGTSCDSEPPAGANQLVVNLWMSLLKVGSLGSKTAAKLSYPLVAIGQFEPGSKISEESRGIQRNPRRGSANLRNSGHRWDLRAPTHTCLCRKIKDVLMTVGPSDRAYSFHIHGIFGHLRSHETPRHFQTLSSGFMWFPFWWQHVATSRLLWLPMVWQSPCSTLHGRGLLLLQQARHHAMPCHVTKESVARFLARNNPTRNGWWAPQPTEFSCILRYCEIV